jgi:alpha-glucoside transport system substrate-binding protein
MYFKEDTMPIYDRQQKKALDQIVEDFTVHHTLSRREFMQRATATGLSFGAAGALLAACGGTSTTPPAVTSIDVLTEYVSKELDSFGAINDAFTAKTGIKVHVESTRDLLAVLNTRVRGNNPPDVAGMPSITEFQTLAQQGKLVQLDSFFNMSQIQQQYSQAWIQFGSVNGHMYAVFPKANTKGTIWYSPKQFQTMGLSIPKTWDELIALSNHLAGSGKFPWAMGVESSASSGWPAADWVDQIYLNLNGADMYDKWVAHKIPWTDASIKNAIQMFGQIVHGTHYINGAPQAILATNFQDASYLPFGTSPKAYMYYLGDFTESFITQQFPTLQAGTDFGFFPFPTINQQFAGSVTGGADIMAAFKDNDGTRQYMQFIASAEAQTIWPKRGGATSVNKSVPLSAYSDPVSQAAAQQLTSATTFRVGADDLMPTQMENAYWSGMLTYIGNASHLDSVLTSLESTANQAYSS